MADCLRQYAIALTEGTDSRFSLPLSRLMHCLQITFRLHHLRRRCATRLRHAPAATPRRCAMRSFLITASRLALSQRLASFRHDFRYFFADIFMPHFAFDFLNFTLMASRCADQRFDFFAFMLSACRFHAASPLRHFRHYFVFSLIISFHFDYFRIFLDDIIIADY